MLRMDGHLGLLRLLDSVWTASGASGSFYEIRRLLKASGKPLEAAGKLVQGAWGLRGRVLEPEESRRSRTEAPEPPRPLRHRGPCATEAPEPPRPLSHRGPEA